MPRASNGVYSAPADGWNPCVAGATVKSADFNALLTDIIAALNQVGYPTRCLGGFANSVNFNSVADTAIAIISPTTNYRIASILIINQGTTASLNTAQYGVFSAAGGAGTAIIASGSSMAALTSNAANTATSLTAPALTVTAFFNLATLYFRITTAQSAVASGSVYVFIEPLP